METPKSLSNQGPTISPAAYNIQTHVVTDYSPTQLSYSSSEGILTIIPGSLSATGGLGGWSISTEGVISADVYLFK